MTSKVQFARRVGVVVTRATSWDRARAFVAGYPGPSIAIAGIILVAVVARAPGVLGLLMFPVVRLVWAYNRTDAASRKLGAFPSKIDTSKIGPVARVSVSDAGLSVEGLNLTISRRALARVTADAEGTTIFVETRRNLPNFTFTVDDPDDARALLDALRDGQASRVRDELPKALQRGMLETEAWVEVLRNGGATGYRSAPLPIDELWRVLASDEAPLAHRAAAAIALAPTLDDRGRRRFKEIKRDAPYPLRMAMKSGRAGAPGESLVKALDACIEADR